MKMFGKEPSSTNIKQTTEEVQNHVAERNKSIKEFLIEAFKGRNISQELIGKLANNQKMEIASPRTVDYKTMKNDVDVSKFGEYTLNPDTMDIDWDTIPLENIKTIELPEKMNGKSVAEIAQYIQKAYPKARFPGLEYYKYICDHPDKAPDNLKDGNSYFFFGSVLRGRNGFWCVPNAYWSDGEWGNLAIDVVNLWSEVCRIVILED